MAQRRTVGALSLSGAVRLPGVWDAHPCGAVRVSVRRLPTETRTLEGRGRHILPAPLPAITTDVGTRMELARDGQAAELRKVRARYSLAAHTITLHTKERAL